MSQPVINELKQLYELWQNGLAGRDVYDAAAKELLGKLVENDSISMSEKQQGLKAAKQYVSNQSLLLESGKQLVQMRLERFRSGDGGPSSSQEPPCSGSTDVSDFRKYGYEDSHDGTSMDESEEPGSGDEQQAESGPKDPESEVNQLCAEEEEYDREAAPILAEIDAAAAAAAAAATGTVKESASDTAPASDRPSSGAAAAAAGSQGKSGSSASTSGAAGSGAAGAADGSGKPAAAAASGPGGGEADSDGDAGMEDSELLSDLDTDDGTAEDVAEADKVALREIRQFQKATNRLVSRNAFKRVAQDVLQQQAGAEFSFDSGAVDALQLACESYLVDTFESTNICAIHAKRQKICVQDLQLAYLLTDPDNWCRAGGKKPWGG